MAHVVSEILNSLISQNTKVINRMTQLSQLIFHSFQSLSQDNIDISFIIWNIIISWSWLTELFTTCFCFVVAQPMAIRETEVLVFGSNRWLMFLFMRETIFDKDCARCWIVYASLWGGHEILFFKHVDFVKLVFLVSLLHLLRLVNNIDMFVRVSIVDIIEVA